MPAKRILSISYDASILKTRQWILENAGYEVVSALGYIEAEAICTAADNFDLIIVGHSVPPRDKAALVKLAKSSCGHGKILSLCNAGQPPLPQADFSTDKLDPEGLMEAVTHALHRR